VDDLERRFRRLAGQRLPTSPPPVARLRSRGRRRAAGGVAGLAVVVALAAVALRPPAPDVRFAEDAEVPATPAPPSTQDPSPAPEAEVVAPPHTPTPTAVPTGPDAPAPVPSHAPSPPGPPAAAPDAGPGAPGAAATPGGAAPPRPGAPPPSPERPVPEVWEGTFAYQEVEEDDEDGRTVVTHVLVLSPRGDGTYIGRYEVSGDVEPYGTDVIGVPDADALLVHRGTPTDPVLFALLPPTAPAGGLLTRWGAAAPVLSPPPPDPAEAFVRVGDPAGPIRRP